LLSKVWLGPKIAVFSQSIFHLDILLLNIIKAEITSNRQRPYKSDWKRECTLQIRFINDFIALQCDFKDFIVVIKVNYSKMNHKVEKNRNRIRTLWKSWQYHSRPKININKQNFNSTYKLLHLLHKINPDFLDKPY
jgi:hypothetical protein